MTADIAKQEGRCPVDFDHESTEHAKNWPDEFREMREKCPLAWTERHGGYWVATKYDDVVRMAQDSEAFTSGKTYDPATGHVEGGITIPETPLPRGLPVESDNPEWDGFRKLINRRFAPKAAEARRDDARKYATALINEFIEKGRCDLVNEYTSPLPALITMDLLGFPLNEWREFADPLHEMAYTQKVDPHFPEVMKGLDWLHDRIRAQIAERRRAPTDDMISHLITEPMNGENLSDQSVQEFCVNILTGGVDTTTGLTSNVLLYLYQNPDAKRRLMENPELIPRAREEFVRYFSPIHALARNVSQERVINGQRMVPGERVLLAYSAANRDPEIFDDPDSVILDRLPNRHVGFGAGMHRCAGSFVARVMFETMLGEWLRRIPEYEIDVDGSVKYPSVATVNGWARMPVTFAPGPREHSDFVL